ncbi:HmuY family protein [Sediminitomix flava]|uniref:Heme-binding HmuY-like protein n=1 Tax=Sediminitomix flava TaxID=379075 RepID=A0A315Z8J3_SEDFL|nr:HmuY family protein [Sediminitomix flava]PWJ41885.1 heme-binding HmuY-like protein [Sediminitomix flava]
MNIQKFSLIALLFSALFLTSCEDEDTNTNPDNPPLLGSTLTAEMGSNLAYQVYVDLSTGEMTKVATNSWDLAIENSNKRIRTNTAKKVSAATPVEDSFVDVSSDEGLQYFYDAEDGDLDKTALAGWEESRPYILDLGIDENGNALGKIKFEIAAVNDTQVTIKFASLDGSDEQETTFDLDTDKDFTYFSFINNKSVSVAPKNWDIMLSAVTVRTGAPCAAMGPAAVPGINCDIYRLTASTVSNNYAGVSVAKDDPYAHLEVNDDPESERNQYGIEESNYDDLVLADYDKLSPSSAANAIGRSWLYILAPHSSGIFKVYDFVTYLVKDVDGNHYKLRFLAYKGGGNAENGYPTFEYSSLED